MSHEGLTDEEKETLRLIDLEILASWLSILSSLLLIDSGERAKREILSGEEDNGDGALGTPTEEAFDALLVNTISTLLYAGVAFTRLDMICADILSGKSDRSLWPNLAISLGFIYSLIGQLLKYDGILGRMEEQETITVL